MLRSCNEATTKWPTTSSVSNSVGTILGLIGQFDKGTLSRLSQAS